ncbi:MAG: TldD/PmbA family protein [Sedimentibacter saalensis]|jgi:PmbA protein|uniref:TldD/PmbA family protein n=1 Tax=Sedimentibacter saalensis TaxID=130788 RepID=UPI002B21B0F4|nr:TldD/PmbA family protein [Sedimentibacter saalensis]MEA5094810.1 TldD/PmbA family protein [Sedimentibacter saalensis]
MDMKMLIDKIFAEGKKQGINDMEVFYSAGSSLSLKVFQKELDGYSLSESEGLGLRGMYNSKMGYSYTEKVDETSIDLLVKNIKENATVIDSDDEEYIFEGSKEYKKVDTFNPKLEEVEEAEKIKFVKQLEEEAFKIDNRIQSVETCVYGDGYGETIMSNTKGLYLHDKSNIAYTYVVVVAKENEDIKTGMAYRTGNDFSKFNPKEIAEEAVKEALSMLGAKSVKSGDYPVVIRNNAAADLLEAFEGIFSAENVQKNLSLLKGKLNEQIGSEKFTLVDDPFMEGGLASRSFDGEGVASKYKKVVDKGVLKTYFHNLKTAKKDRVETTGNASKSSYKSSVGIAPSNLYVEKGEKTLEEIISSMDKGILITELQGLHSGLNSVSGDFSLAALGYEIKDGKIAKAVEQITVAGNYFELLKNIEETGSDLKFGLPGEAYIGSPSLKIKKLAIAGE